MDEVSWWTIPVPSLVILVSSVLVFTCGHNYIQTDRQNHRGGWSLYSRDYRIPLAWVKMVFESGVKKGRNNGRWQLVMIKQMSWYGWDKKVWRRMIRMRMMKWSMLVDGYPNINIPLNSQLWRSQTHLQRHWRVADDVATLASSGKCCLRVLIAAATVLTTAGTAHLASHCCRYYCCILSSHFPVFNAQVVFHVNLIQLGYILLLLALSYHTSRC